MTDKSRMINILPTFLIPGAGKSGTSYLADVLGRHPDVFMPYSKEPSFFSKYPGAGLYSRGIDFYRKSFVGYQGQRHIGDASTVYMYDPDSPGLIYRHVPDAKLIFILRNPIDRVYSNYWQEIKAGRRLPEFESLLSADHDRIKEMIYVSSYDIHIQRYFDLFDRDQILILLYDDLLRNRLETINMTLSFLGLEYFQDGTLLDVEVNSAAVPRSRLLARALRTRRAIHYIKGMTPPSLAIPLKRALEFMRNTNQKPFGYPSMDEEVRHHLAKIFEDSIANLSQMIARDLSHWLSETHPVK